MIRHFLEGIIYREGAHHLRSGISWEATYPRKWHSLTHDTFLGSNICSGMTLLGMWYFLGKRHFLRHVTSWEVTHFLRSDRETIFSYLGEPHWHVCPGWSWWWWQIHTGRTWRAWVWDGLHWGEPSHWLCCRRNSCSHHKSSGGWNFNLKKGFLLEKTYGKKKKLFHKRKHVFFNKGFGGDFSLRFFRTLLLINITVEICIAVK